MDQSQAEKDLGPKPPPRAPFGGSDLVLVLLALAVLGGGGAWWWFHRTPEAPPPAPIMIPTAPPSPTTPPPVTASPTVAPDRLRELLEALSVSATFRKWLAQGDLIQRWVVVTDNLAEGVSPRPRLAFLAPREPFRALKRGDRWVVAEASFKRYDLLADVVGSIDVPAAVRAYRELHGPLEAAYRALGYPEGSLDRVTAAALHRLVAAPVHDGDLEVSPGGEGPGPLYLFASPALEGLGAVEKHLLRMGPRNTRAIQAKARQLERALGFPATPAK